MAEQRMGKTELVKCAERVKLLLDSKRETTIDVDKLPLEVVSDIINVADFGAELLTNGRLPELENKLQTLADALEGFSGFSLTDRIG